MAWYAKLCEELCPRLWHLPKIQKPLETGLPTNRRSQNYSTFCQLFNDLITDLPPIDDCDSILVVIDRGLTKGVILIPTTKTLTADGAGQLLLDNLYKRFGLPNKILPDRGPQFAAQAFKELLKLLGIKSKLTTAYHPQTDGATERVNQEIKAYLSIYCSHSWKETILRNAELM